MDFVMGKTSLSLFDDSILHQRVQACQHFWEKFFCPAAAASRPRKFGRSALSKNRPAWTHAGPTAPRKAPIRGSPCGGGGSGEPVGGTFWVDEFVGLFAVIIDGLCIYAVFSATVFYPVCWNSDSFSIAGCFCVSGFLANSVKSHHSDEVEKSGKIVACGFCHCVNPPVRLFHCLYSTPKL